MRVCSRRICDGFRSLYLVVGGVLLCVSFATSDHGQTSFGQPLGNDFAGFFVAAQILDRGQADQLYDRALHDQLYHELRPKLDPHDSIPYVHPPFVAGVLRPLTWHSYEVAVALWLVISLSLFIAGSSWFSQPLVRISGVQVYSLALIGLGLLELRLADRVRRS